MIKIEVKKNRDKTYTSYIVVYNNNLRVYSYSLKVKFVYANDAKDYAKKHIEWYI